MKQFRTYNIAVEFYRLALTLRYPRHLKDQLTRASSSVVLNLAEGAGRHTPADQCKFFHIALGSLRECQAILDLANSRCAQAEQLADKLAAHLFRLIQKAA